MYKKPAPITTPLQDYFRGRTLGGNRDNPWGHFTLMGLQAKKDAEKRKEDLKKKKW